ncbi:F-box/LRR-repeat protein [Corchorus capsularis]|uniref:F-box/LRR-repeat protein n=1 Tax=Corchorus capsularis TaxID=210143 RepID=A0A1R3IAG5_COCAP|nr:F-box/LRR-repeat protein [Corchorus capsularis]
MAKLARKREKLELCVFRIESMKRLQYPTLSHLKQLELHVILTNGSLLALAPLIKACPSLNKLALKLSGAPSKTYVRRSVKKAKKCVHHSLKVVEVSGFNGQRNATEFCRYVIKNAIMLEKIIIDPIDPIFKGTPLENRHSEKVEAARESAEKLKFKYFLGDKLIVL